MQGAVWGYLSISGGVVTPPVLGSRATHLRTGMGGLDGRTLRADDHLPLGNCSDGIARRLVLPFRRYHRPIAVVSGPQEDYFSVEARHLLRTAQFEVSVDRDRMAMMLDGPFIHAQKGHDIVSDGTVIGSIQMPSSGRLVVLMADCQKTAGFPKIATVASWEISRLAQMPSRAKVRFRYCLH